MISNTSAQNGNQAVVGSDPRPGRPVQGRQDPQEQEEGEDACEDDDDCDDDDVAGAEDDDGRGVGLLHVLAALAGLPPGVHRGAPRQLLELDQLRILQQPHARHEQQLLQPLHIRHLQCKSCKTAIFIIYLYLYLLNKS